MANFGIMLDGINDKIKFHNTEGFKEIFNAFITSAEFALEVRANFSSPIYVFGEEWAHKRSYLTLDLVNNVATFAIQPENSPKGFLNFTLNGKEDTSDKISSIIISRDNLGNVDIIQEGVKIAETLTDKTFVGVQYKLKYIGRHGTEYTDSVIDEINLYDDVNATNKVWSVNFNEGTGNTTTDSLGNVYTFISMPTDDSQWLELINDDNTEIYNFSAIQNVSQALNSSFNKDTNHLALINTTAQLTDSFVKKYDINGVVEQNYQFQATQLKKSDINAELEQGYAMKGYFSTALTEIHQFKATINLAPLNTANFTKKTDCQPEINQVITLSGQGLKCAALQTNYKQAQSLVSNLFKSNKVAGEIEQAVAISAVFLNSVQPIYLHQFRINGDIAFQRFNGATVKQRFNGVIF
ncbi:MAG: hypothetical protein HRT53_20720 [Colwellia sp.]|nr:hypothetical protein [Colwellia sp.]